MSQILITQRHPRSDTRLLAVYAGAIIVLLGALLRLAAFQEALIGADQSSILAAAADIAALRDFPGVGIKSSVGVMQTAIPAYLAAVPLLLVHRVIAVKWFFSVLDLLAIAALYRSVHRAFGLRTAVVATLLYATNPWIVEFTRWIWYQSLIPTFATLAFAALLTSLSGHARESRAGVAVAMVSAALMGLVHLAALPWAIVLCSVALAIAGLHKWWRAAALGTLGALIVTAPYLAFLAQGGVADIALILQGTGQDSRSGGLNTAAYRLSAELLSGRQVLSTPRNPLWAESVLELNVMYMVIPVLLGVSVLWAVTALLTRRHAQRRRGLALTLLWTTLAPTLFLPSHVHLQHFYLLFIFPAPFVLIGAATEALATTSAQPHGRTNHRILQVSAHSMLLASVLLSLWWAHLWIIRIGYEQRGLLRAPTRAWLMDKAVSEVSDYLDRTPAGEVIVLTHFGGESSPFDWMRNFLGTDRVRIVPAGEGLIIPASEACYMVAERASPDQLLALADRPVPVPAMTIPASPPWRFYCTGPRPELPEPQAVWENGLSLITTELEGEVSPGGRLSLVNTWHYDAVTNQEYHFFNHILLDGELVAQIDGDGLPSRYWRDDDVFIIHFTLQMPEALPSGSYQLRVGAYTWPGIVRVPLVDGRDAATIAQWER